jgi:hypothetical protein
VCVGIPRINKDRLVGAGFKPARASPFAIYGYTERRPA